MLKLEIFNTAGTEELYKHTARALGWDEQADPNGWRDIWIRLFREKADELTELTCRNLELLQGKLNYNAEQMISEFKAATVVQLVEGVE